MDGSRAQFALANVDLGKKFHGKNMTRLFGCLAARTARDMGNAMFKGASRNLPFPTAWRLVFDGITIKNGSTV